LAFRFPDSTSRKDQGPPHHRPAHVVEGSGQTGDQAAPEYASQKEEGENRASGLVTVAASKTFKYGRANVGGLSSLQSGRAS
jgi:hypothetical protein